MDLWKCRDPFEDRIKMFNDRQTTSSYVRSAGTNTRDCFRQWVEKRPESRPHYSSNKLNVPRAVRKEGWKEQPCHTEENLPPSAKLTEKPPTSRNLGPNYCAFCKKNGEVPRIFSGHTLKGVVDNRTVVTCPILRQLRCDVCGATGDSAHTRTHCPQSSSVTPIAVLLKSTPRKGNGEARNVFGI